MGTVTATQDKPQSKLWRHDGSWWALMNGAVDDDIYMHRLSPATHTWVQNGPEVDTRRSYGDVLADGDTLYVLSRRTGSGGTVLVRFVYDDATGSYQKNSGYPQEIISVSTETATIAKDSAGVLWVVYTAPDAAGASKVWVTHSTSSDKTWVTPFELPVADTTVSGDDIAAVVALDGKIGVMWSNQLSDTFRFVTHDDGAAPDQWGTLETAAGGPGVADDHVNLKKAADGRLFAAVKTSISGLSSPRIELLVRQTDGTWSRHVHSNKADGMTRPILLLDEAHRRVFMFAATAEGTGAQTYYKSTSMDTPAFGPGRGDPFVTWPGTSLINATSTKQPVDADSGAVVLTGDRDGVRYYHAELPLSPETTIDQAPADPTNSTGASFEFSSDDPAATFECKLDGAAEFTACTSPQDYSDLAPGSRSFEVRAVDVAGVRDPTPASHTWSIDTTEPDTTLDQAPADPSGSTSASFEFSSDDPGASFECKLDDAADFTACTSPQDYQDLAPGTHTFAVRAVDGAGNRDGTPASHTWTIDTPPETTIDQAPADPTSSTGASFEFSSDDPAATFECKLDGAADFTACGSPQDYLDLAPGSHTFRVRAVDAVGVEDPSPAAHTWTIDTTAPETTIDAMPANPTNSTSASFEFSSDDTGASFECKLDDAVDYTPCGSPQDYQDLADGDHSFAVRAVDTAGNEDSTPARYVWTVDTTAPDTTIDQKPPSPSDSTSASFEFSSDAVGATFECKLDGAADFTACGSPQDYQDLADGDHEFAVRAIDPAGNPDATPARYVWTVDTTAPDTAIDQKPADPTNSTSAHFEFSSSDAGASFECKLDGAAEFTSCTSPQDFQDLAPGSHTFSVRAVDAGGNPDLSPATHTWTVDTTAPDTTIDQKPADPTNSTSAHFEFSSGDAGASFECKLDGAADFTACGSPQDYQDLAPGSHTFSVRAVDAAGNRDDSPATHTWTVDTTAPDTTIDQKPADPTDSTSASFTFTSDDAAASFECKLDGAADFTSCGSPQDYQDLAPGSHTFSVRAFDAAGNRDGSPATHTWTIENAPDTDPVIAGAGDVACDSSEPLAEECHQLATANLLAGIDPLDAVLGVGDLQEECGELANYQAFYDPTWGQFKSKTYLVPGNHDYQQSGCLDGNTAGAPGYFSYFGDAATPRQPGCRVSCQGYYSFDLGDWHIIALNSNCGKAGGCQEGSPQEVWLKDDLAATTKSCILAFGHHPRYASKGGASTSMQPLWAALYDGGADFVLAGHAHIYERFARLDRGTPDSMEPGTDPNGMRLFIAGTGGQRHHSIGTIRTGSEVRNNTTFGVMKFTLHSGSYDWEFLPEAGKSFTDSGSETCQGAPRPGDTEPPSTPTDLSATAAGANQVDLSWTASTDNVGVTGYGIYRDGTLIDTTASTSYSDKAVEQATTYEYAVDAVDAKGNRSAQSAPASATTATSPTDFLSASSASSSTTVTSLTVPKPDGVTTGNTMLASVNVRSVQTITPPPGWTLIRTDVNNTVMTMATYYRVADAAEPASYTWGFSVKKAAAAGIVAYTGIDTVSPIDASGGSVNPTSTTITAPSITTTVPDARLVGFFGISGSTTVTPPLDMVERFDIASTFGTDATLEGAGSVLSVAGSTGTRTATAATAARNVGHLVALRPQP